MPTRCVLLAGVLAASCCSGAHAVLMEYTIRAGVHYRLDGQSFPPQIIRIVLTADTDDITFDPATGFAQVTAPAGSTLLDLGNGVPVGTFTNATRVRLSTDLDVFAFAEDSGPDLLSILEPPLSSASLDAPFGPVIDNDDVEVTDFMNIPTSIGQVSVLFSLSREVSWRVVPSPSAATGVALPLLLARRRRRA